MTKAAPLAVFLLALGAARGARADDAGPRNALSLHPFSLAAHGVAVQYERYVAPRRFSLVLGAGFRSSSRQDYESWVTTVGIEPRWWLALGDRHSRLGRAAMVGPYLSLRSDVSFRAPGALVPPGVPLRLDCGLDVLKGLARSPPVG